MRLPIKLNLASITAGDASTRTGFPGLTAHYLYREASVSGRQVQAGA